MELFSDGDVFRAMPEHIFLKMERECMDFTTLILSSLKGGTPKKKFFSCLFCPDCK